MSLLSILMLSTQIFLCMCSGLRADVNYRDCADIYASANGAYLLPSGIYVITVGAGNTPLNVYCDMSYDRGGWTVVQRRVSADIDFYRTWKDYANGFGDLDGNFYIGNTYLSAITRSKQYVLHIELTLWNETIHFADYDNFVVESASRFFTLSSLGTYYGNMGDSMATQLGMKFSTYDLDNDKSDDNCAVQFHGAWWYNACHTSNLNGRYITGGTHMSFADGIEWYTWTGYNYSMMKSVIMIRPINY